MPSPSGLSRDEVRHVVRLLGEVANLKRVVATQCDQSASLNGMKGRPAIKPGGIEKGITPKSERGGKDRRCCESTPRVAVEERVLKAIVPAGTGLKPIGRDDRAQVFDVPERQLFTRQPRTRCGANRPPDRAEPPPRHCASRHSGH
jgi:hypothetical protein